MPEETAGSFPPRLNMSNCPEISLNLKKPLAYEQSGEALAKHLTLNILEEDKTKSWAQNRKRKLKLKTTNTVARAQRRRTHDKAVMKLLRKMVSLVEMCNKTDLIFVGSWQKITFE